MEKELEATVESICNTLDALIEGLEEIHQENMKLYADIEKELDKLTQSLSRQGIS